MSEVYPSTRRSYADKADWGPYVRLHAVRKLIERLLKSGGDADVLSSESFTDSERAVGRMVLPLLENLENARRTIDELTEKTRAVEVLLRLLPVAALILDEDGNLLTSNTTARALFGGPAIPASVLRYALRAVREGVEYESFFVRHPSEAGVKLRIVPAELRDPPLDHTEPRVVFLVAPESDRVVDTDALMSRFGLTPTQARVVHLVAQGLTNKEVSARLDISIETVRKHLAAAFHKTGVGNRASVVALAYGARFGQRPHTGYS